MSGSNCVHAIKADTKAIRSELADVHAKIDYLLYRVYLDETVVGGMKVQNVTFVQWLKAHALPLREAP